MRIQNIPFTILALTPLGPVSDSHGRQPVYGVDLFSLNSVMEEITPGIFIPVPRERCPEGGLTIRLKEIRDFKPDRVIENNPYLKSLRDAGAFIKQAVSDGIAPSGIAERVNTDWPSLPFAFHAEVSDPRPAKETGVVDDILSMVAMPGSKNRSIWALGTLAAGSIATFGWPSRFTDYMSIALKDLALSDAGSGSPMPTEMILSEDRLMEFIEAGITPLMGVEGKGTAFMPRETTMAGGSLKYQLFISRVLTFLWWCREHMKEALIQGDLSSNLMEAFTLFWQQTGHAPPDDLEISADAGSEGDPIPLKIGMTPPGTVLPGGRKLEMTLQW